MKKLLIMMILMCLGSWARADVTNLRCEYQVDPLGVDCHAPRLSWQLSSTKRAVQQTAYRVLVASTPDLLAKNKGDLWNSGKVKSDQSQQVAYAGKALESNQQYFWKVQVWQQGKWRAQWSEAASWSMGVLSPAGWQAQWIAYPARKDRMDFEGAKWIWGLREGEAVTTVAPGACRLSRTFTVSAEVVIRYAQLIVSADNSATVSLNGRPVAEVTDWKRGVPANVKDLLVPGENRLEVVADNGTGAPNPAGMICKLELDMASGQRVSIVSDGQWQAVREGETAVVQSASELATWGEGPWKKNTRIEAWKEGLPVFRKHFTVNDGLNVARVNVSGLGHYELFVNGRKVGDHFLDAPWSVFEKTVYYNSYDITDLLVEGENEFRIMLGKGFYNTHADRRVHGVYRDDELMALLEARLEYTDGGTDVVVTDKSWDVGVGPITHSAIIGGSDYDATAAEPAKWWKAEPTNAVGTLKSSESPAMKHFERLSPVKPVEEPEPNVFVYDFGQNMSALPFIAVRGQKGQVVRLTPAEQRFGQTDRYNNGTGRVNQAGVGAGTCFEYTLRGDGLERWQPQFNYGGFQYLEVTGAVPQGHPNPTGLPVLEQIESVHVRSSAKSVGAFACSNPLFMQIDQSIDWAVRSNLAHVLTDCPHREKLGWLEVSYLMGPSISRRYDLSRLYAKVTRDIRDSQGDDGAIYTVAPAYPAFKAGFRYTPEWGAAGVVLPWQLYRWYGDTRMLEDNLPSMKAFVDYMKDTSADLVPKAGLGDWYDYGHGKGNGPSKFTPPELTAMATFYRCADLVVRTAEVLGQDDDAAHYRALANQIRAKFNEKYYVGNGQYENRGSCQTANAMALVIGLCEPENETAVMDAILADLKQRDYQQTAGDVGFHYLVEALGRYDCHEVVSKVLNRRGEGSYGFIIDRGWSALPEAWDANTGASMNHCMLGHAQQWFYMNVLGIQQSDDSVGFRKLVIKPAYETGLEWAKGHYDSVRGRISVDWEQRGAQARVTVTVPTNTSATIYVPAKDVADVTESGQPIDQVEEVTFLRMEAGAAVFEVGSGTYAFSATMN
jgi:alpha-L-rhamnosidase